MSVLGDWDVTIKTPIGSLTAAYRFTQDNDGIVGTATYRDETVVLQGISVEGQRVEWRQSVTKPMRLNLAFDVVIAGDTMSGHSRAGRLPRSAVSGMRRG